MPRPRKDGASARAPQRRRLDDRFIKSVKPTDRRQMFWDTVQAGLALAVEPSGRKSFKFVYRFNGRPRWYNVGTTRAIGLADARALVKRKSADVTYGTDVQAERRTQRMAGTFKELSLRYRVAVSHGEFEGPAEYHDAKTKKKNKSWRQAAWLIDSYALPSLGSAPATSVTRDDIKAIFRRLTADGSPTTANQVLASISAVYSWGLKNDIVKMPANPCSGIERNETKDRERVLTDTELPAFWSAFDDAGLVAGSALRLLLLTGARPGEVRHMRRAHLDIGVHHFADANQRTTEHFGAWWTLPGEADANWPGTKNGASHRIWITEAALAIINELGDGATGFVFAYQRGRPVRGLDIAMRAICEKVGIVEPDKVTPHDLRRTFGTLVTRLGFTREQMDRRLNHVDGGVGSIYDRHGYQSEAREIHERVSARIMALVGAAGGDNVVPMARP